MDVIWKIYQYRELLKNNVKKEIRGRYKNSILGVLWTFLNPLLQIAVYATIFPIILKTDIPNYVIFVCVGLIPWAFFTSSLTQSASTIIGNANIVKKVYFPREILPISVVFSAAVNFLISSLIILALVVIYKIGIGWAILYFPLVFGVQLILQLGLAFILSSVTVYIRDIEHFLQIGLMMLFYATPIVYSTNSPSFPEKLRFLINLNPMTAIIESYRNIFYLKQAPSLRLLGTWGLISLAVLIVGWLIFNKLQRRFAEEL